MTVFEAWKVGPWTLVPDGLASFTKPSKGTSKDSTPSSSTRDTATFYDEKIAAKLDLSKDWGAAADGKSLDGKAYSERLSSLAGGNQIISRAEVEAFLALSGQGGEENWDLVTSDDKIEVKRHRDRSLCGGVFVRLSAHLDSIKDPADIAACYMDYTERSKWDKQVVKFELLHHQQGSDLLAYTMQVHPLSDRDLVVFHAVLRHESGNGLLVYMRHADGTFMPKGRHGVHATQYVTAVEILQDPRGGVSVNIISALDPKIPFIPKWIMNALVPSEWRKSASAVEKHALEISKRADRPACAHMFGKAVETTDFRTTPAEADCPTSPTDDATGPPQSSPAASPNDTLSVGNPPPEEEADDASPWGAMSEKEKVFSPASPKAVIEDSMRKPPPRKGFFAALWWCGELWCQ